MSGPTPLAGLYKVSYSGTIGTEEIFVYSRWVSNAATSVQEDIADLLDTDVTDMLAQAVTLGPIPTLQALFPDYVVWTQLKVSPWDPATNKLSTTDGDPAYRILTDHGSAAASSGLPYQSAIAVTTRSAVAGRRKYNRFYLPTPCQTATDGHGVLQSPVGDAIALWYHLNITARAADALDVRAVNWNPGTGVGHGQHAIEDIYLGRRIDTIRRRRNDAPEPRTIDTL